MACLKFTRGVWKAFMQNGGHDAQCISQLVIRDAKPGVVNARFKIEPKNVNRLQSLHGGLVSTLVDSMGSLALATRGLYSTGVSTDITVSFVRSAGKAGDEVDVKSEVVSLGRTLASTRIELRHPETQKLLAFGSHTKFVAKALEHERNVKFSEDGESVVEGKLDDSYQAL